MMKPDYVVVLTNILILMNSFLRQPGDSLFKLKHFFMVQNTLKFLIYLINFFKYFAKHKHKKVYNN